MACADVFMDMSLSCSLLTRQERLTPVFLHLLKDDSKWVRKAAFQSLGPFISTFSVVSSQNETSESLEPLSDGELLDNSLLGETPSVTMTTTSTRSLAHTQSDTARSQTDSNDLTPPKSVTPPKPLTPPLSDQEILQDEFNLFQYWRSPIQPLALDNETSATTTAPNVASTIEPANTSPSQSSSVPEDSDEISGAQGGVTNHIFNSLRNHQGLIEGVAREEEVASRYESEGNHDDGDGLTDIKDELLAESEGVADESCDIFDYKINQKLPLGSNINGLPQVRVTFVQNTTEENPIGNLGVPNESMLLKTSMEMSLVEMSSISEPFYVTGSDQDVVPQELIDIYLSMTDPTKAQSVDLDLPLYCAFSFPAVLQTLGPDHWQLLKPTFMILSRDVQVIMKYQE
jgi:serine/threonine-protein phosphatase 4 regulatory subunit 1